MACTMRTAGNDGVLVISSCSAPRRPRWSLAPSHCGKAGSSSVTGATFTHTLLCCCPGPPTLGGVQRIGQNQSVNLVGFALQLADQKKASGLRGPSSWIVQAQKSLVVNLLCRLTMGWKCVASAIQKPGEVVGNQGGCTSCSGGFWWAGATRMSDKPSRCSCWRTWSERMFRN